MDFEAWYQQGFSCYRANLPDWLKKQAFSFLVQDWKRKGQSVEMWHIRAFVYGATGFDGQRQQTKYVCDEFAWPDQPPPGWQFMILVYPDRLCCMDYGHPVSRKFWSEENGFFSLPPDPNRIFDQDWYEKMGFNVMQMQPGMAVSVFPSPNKHLRLI